MTRAGRRLRPAALALSWLLACMAADACADTPRLQLARLDRDGAVFVAFDVAAGSDAGAVTGPLAPALRTPLGSLWKLFVHAWLLDRQVAETGYTCRGQLRDEVYCCAPGERIGRSQALLRSCGLYYAPSRLGIDAGDWRDYWQARQAPAWLADLGALGADTDVPVIELLQAMDTLPAQAELRASLLDTTLTVAEGRAVAAFGSRLRVKTWSWHRGVDPEVRIGGFAGWLSDGTPIWASGPGTSVSVLARDAERIGAWLPTRWPAEAGDCVDVELFQRYPIAAVRRHGDATPAHRGRLHGRFEVEFANGNRLAIDSRGELLLHGDAGSPKLLARLAREDYVARVIDREAAAEPLEAARALAIVIRSYLQQNARRDGDCLLIADSSAQQRVAPRAASPAARAVAAFTADLVLTGATVRYHLDQAEDGRLAWADAVAQAQAGHGFEAILAAAFPRADLSHWSAPRLACQPLPQAERWLSSQLPRWRRTLDVEPGFEPAPATVCRLASGRPHVDRARGRIFVRGLLSQQDRLDLAHEYLHLAFAAHPVGLDETYIEQLARRLILETAP